MLGSVGGGVAVTGFTPFTWTWAGEAAHLVITETGLTTLNLWMREDGGIP